MSQQIKTQISKLQSQADKAQHEKKSSKQKNKKKEPKKDTKLMHVHTNDQRRTKYATYGGHGDGQHDLDWNKAKSCGSLRYPTVDQQLKKLGAVKMEKEKYDVKLTNIKKDNLYILSQKCNHKWSGASEGKCIMGCGLMLKDFNSQKDEKGVMIQPIEDLQKLYDIVCKEWEMARDALRAGLGDRPIRMKITHNFVITTTVTTGVTNTVTCSGGNNGLNPGLATEWSTLAALFDEYRLFGGHLDFVYKNQIAVNLLQAVTSNSLPVIGFDEDNATSAVSSLGLTQLSQHKILTPMAGGSDEKISPSGPIHHQFHWHQPKGVVQAPGQTFNPGNGWYDVVAVGAGGDTKFYHVGTEITAVNTGAGIVYFDVEFRCRS